MDVSPGVPASLCSKEASVLALCPAHSRCSMGVTGNKWTSLSSVHSSQKHRPQQVRETNGFQQISVRRESCFPIDFYSKTTVTASRGPSPIRVVYLGTHRGHGFDPLWAHPFSLGHISKSFHVFVMGRGAQTRQLGQREAGSSELLVSRARL